MTWESLQVQLNRMNPVTHWVGAGTRLVLVTVGETTNACTASVFADILSTKSTLHCVYGGLSFLFLLLYEINTTDNEGQTASCIGVQYILYANQTQDSQIIVRNNVMLALKHITRNSDKDEMIYCQPISVLSPVPMTIPRHLPAAMFVPYNDDTTNTSSECMCTGPIVPQR